MKGLRGALSDGQNVQVDGMDGKKGERKKEGNGDDLKSFDIYSRPRVSSFDLDVEKAREIFE
jgi:hypothetical protein